MNRQQLNITVGSDVILNVTLVHEEEVLIPALIENLEANLISGLGTRTALETGLGADYITIAIPWVEGRLAGCHSLEVKGSINGLSWAAIGKGLIRYTNATEAGADSVTVEADAYDVTMEAGYHYSDSPIVRVDATVDDEVGTPSVDVTYVRRILSLAFHNLKGNGITSIEVDESEDDHGENVVTVNYVNGESDTFTVRNGSRGNGIASIVKIADSEEDGGVNTWRITDTDGNEYDITLRNGHKGTKGDTGDTAVYDPSDPDTPDFEMATGIGDSTAKSMTQKAITDEVSASYQYTEEETSQEYVVVGETDKYFAIESGQRTKPNLQNKGSAASRATIPSPGYLIKDEFSLIRTIHVPTDYEIVIRGVVALGNNTGSYEKWAGNGDIVPSAISPAIPSTINYLSFTFKKVDNTDFTTEEIEELSEGFYLHEDVVELREVTPSGRMGTIGIVGTDGNVERMIFNRTDKAYSEIYDKQAVDDRSLTPELKVNALTCVDDGETARRPVSTGRVDIGTRSPVASSGGHGIGEISTTNIRATLAAFERKGKDLIDLTYHHDIPKALDDDGNVRIYLPAGYQVQYFAADTLGTTTTSAGGDRYPASGSSYDRTKPYIVDVPVGTTYKYVAFNFIKRVGGGGNETFLTSDLDTIMSEVKFLTYTKKTEIVVVNKDGEPVRTFYSETLHDTEAQLYDKQAVDELLGKVTPIRVCQYNVGHFDMGMGPTADKRISDQIPDGDPSLPHHNYDVQLKKWIAKIQNINPDIMTMEEYEPNFGTKNGSMVATADTGIFDPLPYLSYGKYVGNYWMMNCLASKFRLIDVADVDLGSTVSIKVYMRVAIVELFGKSVKIAATHLNWSQAEGYKESREIEIKNIIKYFSDEPYVIIGGDFNIDRITPEEFDVFFYGFDEDNVHYNGGYTMANHGLLGDILTSVSTGSRPDLGRLTPTDPIDNIIVRGFRMANVVCIDDGTITDHCGLMCDLYIQ